MKRIMLGTVGFIFTLMVFGGFSGSSVAKEMKDTSKNVAPYAASHGDAW